MGRHRRKEEGARQRLEGGKGEGGNKGGKDAKTLTREGSNEGGAKRGRMKWRKEAKGVNVSQEQRRRDKRKGHVWGGKKKRGMSEGKTKANENG